MYDFFLHSYEFPIGPILIFLLFHFLSRSASEDDQAVESLGKRIKMMIDLEIMKLIIVLRRCIARWGRD